MKNPVASLYNLGRRITEKALPKALQKLGMSAEASTAIGEAIGGVAGVTTVICGTMIGISALVAMSTAVVPGLLLALGAAALTVAGAGMGREVFRELRNYYAAPPAAQGPAPVAPSIAEQAAKLAAASAPAFKAAAADKTPAVPANVPAPEAAAVLPPAIKAG